jgi:hypothetical protein
VTLPARFDMQYPAPLAPEFDVSQKLGHLEYLETSRPELVLIGDSQLFLGIDRERLSADLGLDAYKIAIPGSGSAIWYLVMKNSVVEASHTPRLVVVTFRDTLLTLPDYRVNGRYFDLVDDFAKRSEPVLLQLAYINQMSPAEMVAERYMPLYSARREIREGLDRALRYDLPALSGCDAACADTAVESVFGRERLDPAALSAAVDAAQQSMFTPAAFDFDERVGRSFLPEIIQLASERGIKIAFVRMKTLIYPTPASEPPAMSRYMQRLRTYIEVHGAAFVDFGHDERLRPELFFDEMHFTSDGAAVFTDLLAAELEPILGE